MTNINDIKTDQPYTAEIDRDAVNVTNAAIKTLTKSKDIQLFRRAIFNKVNKLTKEDTTIDYLVMHGCVKVHTSGKLEPLFTITANTNERIINIREGIQRMQFRLAECQAVDIKNAPAEYKEIVELIKTEIIGIKAYIPYMTSVMNYLLTT